MRSMSFKSSLVDPLSKLASLLSAGEYWGYLAMCWKRQHKQCQSDVMDWFGFISSVLQECYLESFPTFLRHTHAPAALPLHPAEVHNPQSQEQRFILAAEFLSQQRMETQPQQGCSRRGSWGQNSSSDFLLGTTSPALPKDRGMCQDDTAGSAQPCPQKTAWLKWHHEGKTASAP